MKSTSRFQKYLDKFKRPSEDKTAKKTLGEDLAEQVQNAVKNKVEAMLPLYANRGACMIHTNSGSFWNQPQKYLTVTVLIVFDKDVKWKE